MRERLEVLLNALAGTRAHHALRRLRHVLRQPDHRLIAGDVLSRLRERRRAIGDDAIRGAAILEIGSGRELGLAITLVALGARRVVNVEIDRFGFIDDAALYRLLVQGARADGVEAAWPPAGTRLVDGGRRLVPDGQQIVVHLGESAARIPEPDAAFDFTLSVSVLQHIRRPDLGAVARELRRVTRPGGRGWHRLDFAAMAGHPLGHLRYDERSFARMYGNRDLYVNRYRADDLGRIFVDAGFDDVRFEDLRLLEGEALLREVRGSLDPEFAGKEESHLRARSALLVVARAAAAASLQAEPGVSTGC